MEKLKLMDELINVLDEIAEELSKPSKLDIANAGIGIISIILTVVVLWYNHRSIKLTQRSVRQAINLQLYEKRLEYYSQLPKDNAFKEVPLGLKIVYSDEIYNLYKETSHLCETKVQLIEEFYLVFSFVDGKIKPFWNICDEQFQKYIDHLDLCLKGCNIDKRNSLLKHKQESEKIQRELKKYTVLEDKMQNILRNSLDK